MAAGTSQVCCMAHAIVLYACECNQLFANFLRAAFRAVADNSAEATMRCPPAGGGVAFQSMIFEHPASVFRPGHDVARGEDKRIWIPAAAFSPSTAALPH